MISKKLLVCMLFVCVSVSAQDYTTESLKSMTLAQLFEVPDNIVAQFGMMQGKVQYAMESKNYSYVQGLSGIIDTIPVGRYNLLISYRGNLEKIIEIGLFNKNITGILPTVYNYQYIFEAYSCGGSKHISELKLDDIFSTDSVVLNKDIECGYYAMMVNYIVVCYTKENVDNSLYQALFDRVRADCKAYTLICPDSLYRKVLSINWDINIMLEWINAQTLIPKDIKSYILPYGEFVSFSDRSAEDVVKIKAAIQTVAFSDNNDIVANAHLKLLQKLNMIK